MYYAFYNEVMEYEEAPEREYPALEARSAEGKRRKLRKGTHSCHECKRRKIKCQFLTDTDAICVSCRRRGVPCVGPEFEGHASALSEINPMVRVENLLQQVLAKLNALPNANPTGTVNSNVMFTPELTASIHGSPEECLAPDGTIISVSSCEESEDTMISHAIRPSRHTIASSKHAELSRTLYAAMPSASLLESLRQARPTIAVGFYLMNVKTHRELERDGVDIQAKLVPHPSPDMHPALLVRQMLIFALLLRHLERSGLNGDTEDPKYVSQRLASTAIDALTTNEELLGTAEGLECMVLKGVYQSACGNLRQSWLTFRKALTFGQMMGIHRPDGLPIPKVDPVTAVDGHFLWLRIVHMDRFLSLTLGLPQGTSDMSMALDAATLADETPIEKLERIHTRIAGRILLRNESSTCCQNYSITSDIDAELVSAAAALPGKFWLPRTFTDADYQDINSEFWETVRLTTHINHYNLLCHLHLPYLLRSRSDDRSYEYSRLACANASREILIRFNTKTHFSHFANFCRRVDFFALVACMTLLFAHIDSHRRPPETADKLLAHQRVTDYAMACQVLEIMEQMATVNNHDALSRKGVNLLQRLLTIESDAASGKCYAVHSVLGTDASQQQTSDALCIKIPYFGIVKISRVGEISKEVAPVAATSGSGSGPSSNTITEDGDGIEDPDPGNSFTTDIFDFGLQLQGDLYPGVTAGVDGWALQGTDMAFFDSLIRGLPV
ncbi:hypothetical protein BDV06DRAFT_227489 [Aspergillus oleicola]